MILQILTPEEVKQREELQKAGIDSYHGYEESRIVEMPDEVVERHLVDADKNPSRLV